MGRGCGSPRGPLAALGLIEPLPGTADPADLRVLLSEVQQRGM